MTSVILGLGSNLGDRRMHLMSCINLLSQFIDIKKQSSLHETSALLPDGAPESWNMPFLNMVVSGSSVLPAATLLQRCKQVEAAMGREENHAYWSPRIIDIDLLDYNGELLHTPALTLPHPAMAERRFVLQPLAEILPNWQHPVMLKTAQQLLEDLP